MPDTASPTFITPPTGTTKDAHVPDDLYQRYQTAHRAHQAHSTDCTRCTDRTRCPDGQRLYNTFARLQDVYLERQRNTR